MSDARRDLIAWYGEMVDAYEAMSPEDRAELEEWDRARGPDGATSEWPRWSEFIREYPAPPARADRESTVDQPLPDGFYVYRLWSKDETLLYVGLTVRPAARLAAHRRRWGHLFEWVTWERHDTAESMIEAEARAIGVEYPALNKAGV